MCKNCVVSCSNFLFCGFFIWFWCQGYGSPIERISECPLHFTFWNSLGKIGISSCLCVCQNSPVKLSSPGLLFAGNFLISSSLSLLVFSLLNCLFLPESLLKDCMFLEICPFLLDCPICQSITEHGIFLCLFIALGFSFNLSSFISYFVYLGPFSFFVKEPGKRQFIYLAWQFYFSLPFLLKYSGFTILCQFLLYSKVNQLYAYTYPLFFWVFLPIQVTTER